MAAREQQAIGVGETRPRVERTAARVRALHLEMQRTDAGVATGVFGQRDRRAAESAPAMARRQVEASSTNASRPPHSRLQPNVTAR